MDHFNLEAIDVELQLQPPMRALPPKHFFDTTPEVRGFKIDENEPMRQKRGGAANQSSRLRKSLDQQLPVLDTWG